MSVAFRREFLGASAVVRVDAAFGADLTTNSAGWSWTDITSDVLYAGQAGVTIDRIGRSDESSTAQPAGFHFSLKNDSGNYTVGNPTSTYYPNVRRQTPVRVIVNLGVGDVVRAQGYVKGWVPGWDDSGDHSIVNVSCSGALDRLQQGSPDIQSAIYRSTARAPGLVSYAPMEDDSGATSVFVLAPQPQKVLLSGSLTFGGETTLLGAKQAAVLTATSYLGLQTYGYQRGFSGNWQVDWFMKFTGSDPAAETILMRTWAPSGPVNYVDVVYGGGNWGIRVYGTTGALGSSIFSPPSGQNTGWWHWHIMAHDAGGGAAEYKLVVYPTSGSGSTTSVTIASTTPGNVSICTVLPQAGLAGVAMCHWTIFDQFNYLDIDLAAKDGYDGENAITRLQRLCSEESVEITVTGSTSITMGPQRPTSLMTLLRECETAEGGVLFDGLNAGLSFIAESSRYNASAALTLNASSKQVIGPPQATHDDQRDLNRATVTLTRGGSATFQQTDGVLGSDAIGVYDTSITANLEDADEALDLASWRVHLGQADGLRYPQLALDLVGIAKQTGSASIPTSWLSCTVGSRIDMTNLRSVASTFLPGTVSTLMEGWSETITPKTWKATVNASPFSPWDVGILDTDRADCGASVTGSTMTTSSTTVDVLVSDACTWSHSDGDFSITIGGEEMTVTAVSGTSTASPALVAVGTAAASSSAAISPGLPGGATAAGNLLLMLASCRDTNAIDTDMYITGATGWEKIIDGVQLVVFAKVHSGSETTPTVHHSSAITGDTMLAQIASFSGKWGDPKSQLVAVAQQFNAAAQDIAYPSINYTFSGGVLIIWAGWKADDWTSVATLSGVTEISETTSTLGNDAGQVWDTNNAAWGAGPVSSGSFTVTGGTTAISRGTVFALATVYQTLTVTRGVNGITRAHSLGEEVHVTSPLVTARQ